MSYAQNMQPPIPLSIPVLSKITVSATKATGKGETHVSVTTKFKSARGFNEFGSATVAHAAPGILKLILGRGTQVIVGARGAKTKTLGAVNQGADNKKLVRLQDSTHFGGKATGGKLQSSSECTFLESLNSDGSLLVEIKMPDWFMNPTAQAGAASTPVVGDEPTVIPEQKATKTSQMSLADAIAVIKAAGGTVTF